MNHWWIRGSICSWMTYKTYIDETSSNHCEWDYPGICGYTEGSDGSYLYGICEGSNFRDGLGVNLMTPGTVGGNGTTRNQP